MGRKQATNEWQAELSAMGMTAEYQINSGIGIGVEEFWPMSQ